MILKGTVLLLMIVAASAKNTYMVTAPKRITLGQPYTVNVNILNATDVVEVEVGILRSWYNGSRFGRDPIVSSFRLCVKDEPEAVTLIVPRETVIGSYILKVKGSGALVFEREETLQVVQKTISVFIQTDKAVYKPGQRVHFRTFAVFPDLKIYKGPIDVDIYDARLNRIRRWVSISDPSGVSERDMVLSVQPVLGDWRIDVSVPEFITLRGSKHFTVKKYELPKFVVNVELPPFALISDESLRGTIKANYTYGKGVKGMAEVRVFVGDVRNSCGNLAKYVQKAFPIDGSAEFSVPVAEIKKIRSYLNHQTITVVADVKEELTGKIINGSSKMTYYLQSYKINFMDSSPTNFKPGLPYRAYVKLTQQDGRPVTDVLSGVQVYACVHYERKEPLQYRYQCNTFTGTYALPVLNLDISPDGVMPVDVETPDNATQVSMKVYYKDVYASLSAYKSQSPSDTYLQARLRTLDPKAGGEAHFDIQVTSVPEMVFYQISSRGSVVVGGVVNVKDASAAPVTLTLKVDITPAMSPTANLLVYFVKADGEIVADAVSFNVDGIFENKVSIGFSETTATPHSDVMVNVNADLNSNVYLLAVDQSVLLLKSGNDITTDKVMDELRTYDTTAVNMDSWRFPVPTTGKNAQQIFQSAKVLVLTDATLYGGERVMYQHNRGYSHHSRYDGLQGPSGMQPSRMFDVPRSATVDISGPAPQLKEVERTREIFPETLLWTNTTISSESGESLKITVPDTITSWIASAFAVNKNSGLGVAPTTAKLKVFRSFFVSLNLPLSVVKGEHVVVQANVFNYMEFEQEVTVELKANSGFRSVVIGSGSGEQMTSEPQTVRVPPGEANVVFFPIIPIALGMVDIEVSARTPVAADAVKRQLTVKPEGIPKELNIPVIVDLTSEKTFSITMKVSAPPGLVEGSERIRLSLTAKLASEHATLWSVFRPCGEESSRDLEFVSPKRQYFVKLIPRNRVDFNQTGDLLGPTIDNIEDLLALPTGCGEQNMLKFSPNIYIADYLMATNQMSPELEAKIKTYLEAGYQRQLSYQRWDGSFSTFGERDEAGSVLLTSFVVKSFYQARRYIYIDNSTIDSALNWLLRKQKTSGGFNEPGRVIDRQLQGSTGAGPSLTAYVLLTLVETIGHNGTQVNATRLQQAIEKTALYLEQLPLKTLDTYPLAITAYALSLANSKLAGSAFYQLKKKSKSRDGMMYWDVNVGDSKNSKETVESVDILTTSYALMTLVNRKKFTPGMSVMNWLTSQRSPRGGFISSQDTTVALEALTKFLARVQPDDYNIEITLTAEDVMKTVNINNDNALVLQNIDLTSIPTELTITAEGTGMATVELGIFYNVMSTDDTSDVFDVSTVLLDDTINGFTLMTCAKHLGGGSSGMCVESIQIPSGFAADLSSAGNIAGLKRLEQNGQTVVAYMDKVGESSTCFTLSCSRTDMVAKNKEVYISIVDYYKPNHNTVVSYHPRELKKSGICHVCEECPGCGDMVV